MQFKNPVNGHVDSPWWPVLWVLFFGPLYYLVTGLFGVFFIWMSINVVLIVLMGIAGLVPILVGQLFAAVTAESTVRKHYLRKGWIEVGAEADKAQPTPTHVKCPDCAELVLKEARVCKHCGCKLVPQP